MFFNPHWVDNWKLKVFITKHQILDRCNSYILMDAKYFVNHVWLWLWPHFYKSTFGLSLELLKMNGKQINTFKKKMVEY